MIPDGAGEGRREGLDVAIGMRDGEKRVWPLQEDVVGFRQAALVSCKPVRPCSHALYSLQSDPLSLAVFTRLSRAIRFVLTTNREL